MDLFISHSSRDSAAAKEVVRRLAEHGHRSVFLDLDPDVGIAAGDAWERAIYSKLRSCRAVVVLCSDHYLASHWCFAELALARMTGKHIFPMLVEGLSEAAVLPAMLLEQQCVDVRSDPEEGFRRLRRGLKEKGIERSDRREWNSDAPPFPGLLAFGESDAPVFFARDRESDEVMELLNRAHRFGHPRLVLILGASGSGKSSVLRAGIVPQLRRDREQWLVIEPFRPGPRPHQELAASLATAFRSFGGEVPYQVLEDRLQDAGHPEPSSALSTVLTELRLRSPHRRAKSVVIVDQFEELLGYEQTEHAANRFLRLLSGALQSDDSSLVLATMRLDYLSAFQHAPGIGNLEFRSLTIGPVSDAGLRDVVERPAELGGIELEPELTEALLRDTGKADALPLLAFTLRVLWDRHHQQHRFALRDYEVMGGLQGAIAQEAERVLERTLQLGTESDLRRALVRLARISDDDASFARQPVRWEEMPASVLPMLRLFVEHRLLASRGDGSVEVAHEALFRSWQRLAQWLHEDREFLLWHRRVRSAASEWRRMGNDPGALLRGRSLAEAERWADERRGALDDAELRYIQASGAERQREREAEEAALARERARDEALAAAQTRHAAEQVRARRSVRRNRMLILAAVPVIPILTYVMLMFFVSIDVPVVGLEFSRDGRTLAVANHDRNIVFWDVATRTRTGEPLVGDASMAGSWEAAAFSPDGRFLAASSSFTGSGVLWNLPRRTESRWNSSQTDVVRKLVFSPDSRLLASASDDRTILLRDSETSSAVGTPFTAGQGKILSLAFSPDGRTLASGGADRTIVLWDVPTRQPRKTLERQHDDAITALAFNADGSTLASGSDDRTVRLWNVATGTPISTPVRLEASVVSLVFSPDGQALAATASYEKKLYLWRVSDRGVSGEPLDSDYYLRDAVFSPDSRLVATGDHRGVVMIWDAVSRKPVGPALD